MQNFKDNLTDANGGGLETKQRAAIQSNKTLIRKSVVGVSAFALNTFYSVLTVNVVNVNDDDDVKDVMVVYNIQPLPLVSNH